MTDTAPVTPAQEAVTAAMLATFIACIAVNYALITTHTITTITGYITITIATLVTAGYLVPNLTAHWIGRSFDDIMDTETTVETTLDESTDTTK